MFHIHLRYSGDHDELYFRDYLNEHPQIAREYEGIKLQLWKQFEHDRDAYTNAKTAFIRTWTQEAKKVSWHHEYQNTGKCIWHPCAADHPTAARKHPTANE